MKDITPFFWFDTNAEEAVNYYVEIFPDAKITSLTRYGEGMHIAAGTVMTMGFELLGQNFIALNGGLISPFHQPYHFLYSAKHKKKSISCGITS